MHDPVDSPQRRRDDRRDAVAIRTTLFNPLFSEPVEIDSLNLSPGGMFIVSDYLLPVGETVLLEFAVPGTHHRVIVEANVVRAWHGRTAGMGLSFHKLPKIQQRILRTALERWRARTAPAPDSDGAWRC